MVNATCDFADEAAGYFDRPAAAKTEPAKTKPAKTKPATRGRKSKWADTAAEAGAPPPKISLVAGDDWDGLYLDGKLIDEGHSVTAHGLARALGLKIAVVSPDQAWLERRGNLPGRLNDVRRESGRDA